jgi:glycosyltransferase involved in cell wall biosynthesis
LKLLVISQYFWPETFSINEVVHSLKARGVDVAVLTGKPNYPDGTIFKGYRAWGCQKENREGITIYRVPLIPRGKNSAIGLVANYISFIFSVIFFGPWMLLKERPDSIFVYCPSPLLQALGALFLGWIKRVPVIIWVQDLWPESLSATGHIQNDFVLWIIRKIVQFIYGHADLLLVQSRAFLKPVSDLACKTPIKYFPNSADVKFTENSESDLQNLPVLDTGFTVMFAGNIGTGQAPHVILDAATLLKENKQIKFIILGDGSRREWLKQQVDDRGLANLNLLGRYPASAMPGFMQRASTLLVTLADREIFAATVPNKVQAYMAAGRPIIACMNGEGARLVQEADAGLTVPAENSEALAAAVLQLYEMSKAERDKLGANGRAYYRQHFDHEKLITDLIAHLNDLVKDKK